MLKNVLELGRWTVMITLTALSVREKGRGGSIFCDEYAQLTGSRIAYGGCYDRNDASNLLSYYQIEINNYEPNRQFVITDY
jgi:hypothetical protein